MFSERDYEQANKLAQAQIDAGLAKLKQDNDSQPAGNGMCADCDVQIPAARLQALPNAARCVECQTGHDRRGR